ncbi:HAD family hydrolase [Lysobacter lacus]|uniref:HAD family hydrolase n=2 Tax=Cognatilysobacter lacus TaxID=1643323 RepID=A0A5D8ZBF8_9GAMM|nr:HAD family hydrolase [Lysobacter lacus]
MVGFDGDDTLWRSEDYFAQAQATFESIVAPYVELRGDALHARLYEVEKRNLAVFGYGVKGMALSMIEAAVDITDARIDANAIHRIVQLAQSMLQHPVELLPGIREAVERVASRWPVVLITKGDLFHQEAKVRESGLSALFRRIEIVSEKDVPTYARLLEELGVEPHEFAMVGNSLRSDIAPVVALGGWGVHVPYHLTWVHEREAGLCDPTRAEAIGDASQLHAALASIERRCAAAETAAE